MVGEILFHLARCISHCHDPHGLNQTSLTEISQVPKSTGDSNQGQGIHGIETQDMDDWNIVK